MNNRKKILLVAPLEPMIGGMVVYTHQILKSKLADDFQLEVFDVSIPEFFVKYPKWRIFLSIYFIVGLFCKIVVYRPSIAHIHSANKRSFYEKTAMAFICRISFVKVILHIHGSEFGGFLDTKSKILQITIKFLFRIFNKIIVLSEYWKEKLYLYVSSEKVVLIPNAVYVQSFKIKENKEESILKILFIGTIGFRKGLSDLAEALHILKHESKINFFVDIVGPELYPGDFEKITDIYNNYNLGDVVNFYGAVMGDSKIEMLANADVFVLPSRNENFPISILEAMASGLPIISTNVGGIPDCVEDGVNGFLIEPKDVMALKNAIFRLCDDSKLRQMLGIRNRKEADGKYNWSVVADKINKLYSSL